MHEKAQLQSLLNPNVKTIEELNTKVKENLNSF